MVGFCLYGGGSSCILLSDIKVTHLIAICVGFPRLHANLCQPHSSTASVNVPEAVWYRLKMRKMKSKLALKQLSYNNNSSAATYSNNCAHKNMDNSH